MFGTQVAGKAKKQLKPSDAIRRRAPNSAVVAASTHHMMARKEYCILVHRDETMVITSFCVLLLLAALSCRVSGFVPHQKDILIRPVPVPCHHLTFRPIKQRRVLSHAKQEEFDKVPQANDHRGISTEELFSAQRIMGALSAVAWILM